ncbi:MAG: hypothetical protein PUE14_11450 [Clostridia bacterium]|nr:hypothetical protein [Clostridia bacterium]
MSNPELTVVAQRSGQHAGVEILSNGAFFYLHNGRKIHWAHSSAESADGRRINTRTAQMGETLFGSLSTELGEAETVTTLFFENGLTLEREIQLIPDVDYLIVRAYLKDESGETATRHIAPIDTPYPSPEGDPLFLELDQKMLLVPYDNDMWVRYESTPLRPGRRSYDVSAIYNEENRHALVLGALDHKVWKNAVTCSGFDARSVVCESGVADLGTHDVVPHGIVRGEKVASARFVMLWTEDVRDGMELFGTLCSIIHPPIQWPGKVPFGFNTYSGFGGRVDLPSWQVAGDLIHEELKSFGDEDGVTYINLDATFGLDENEMRKMVDAFHARGQKCGTYAAPFVGHRRLGLDHKLLGNSGLTFADLLLRDEEGRLLPTPDSLAPLDVTHPAWEEHMRLHLKHIIDMGFDYLKIDFLAHAAMEGVHYDPSCMTGRQALVHGYEVIVDELSKADRPIFLSLSIAPLFPHGYGHARRQCCDSFGHSDDVRYVLNALNYAWWTNRKLYAFNDPDHITLYQSIVDKRSVTLEEEARSRYNSAVISGTVMLLSDNYGPHNDEETIKAVHARAARIADNERLNAIAREGVAFRPVEIKDSTTQVYTSVNNGKRRAAFFNYSSEPATVSVTSSRANWPQKGTVTDINRNITWQYDTVLSVALAPYDSAVLEWE